MDGFPLGQEIAAMLEALDPAENPAVADLTARISALQAKVAEHRQAERKYILAYSMLCHLTGFSRAFVAEVDCQIAPS